MSILNYFTDMYVLVVNYGVSNTVALETPWFTAVPAIHASPTWVSIGWDDGLQPVRYQVVIRANTGILLIGFMETIIKDF